MRYHHRHTNSKLTAWEISPTNISRCFSVVRGLELHKYIGHTQEKTADFQYAQQEYKTSEIQLLQTLKALENK